MFYVYILFDVLWDFLMIQVNFDHIRLSCEQIFLEAFLCLSEKVDSLEMGYFYHRKMREEF